MLAQPIPKRDVRRPLIQREEGLFTRRPPVAFSGIEMSAVVHASVATSRESGQLCSDKLWIYPGGVMPWFPTKQCVGAQAKNYMGNPIPLVLWLERKATHAK